MTTASAYKALQLDPRASHDLVEGAYWALTAQLKQQLASSAQGVVGRLRSLNNAYAVLVDPEKRARYDDEHGLAGRRRLPLISPQRRGLAMLFKRKPVFTTKATLYELLHVDPDASRGIIDLAHEYRHAQLSVGGYGPAYERKMVDEAYAVLRDPQRRAQYDQKIGRLHESMAPAAAAPKEEADTPEMQDTETAAAVEAAEQITTTAADVPAEAPVAEVYAASEPEPEAAAPAPLAGLPEPAVASNGAEAPAMEGTAGREQSFSAEEAPSAHLTDEELPAVSDGAGEERRSRRLWPFGRKTEEDDDGEREPARRITLPRFGRTETDEELAAEMSRLLALSGDQMMPPAPQDEGHAARARFFFTAGPQRGEQIFLRDGSLIFGSSDHADIVLANPDGSIGAGHVRVWHRDGEYVLHQLDAFSTTFVNGERLDLRLVILEPGDQIQIGPHVAVFEPVPQPAPVQPQPQPERVP